jgi:hypothetical protein
MDTRSRRDDGAHRWQAEGMPDWDAFATICGTAAGALVGLLFVAVSIRADLLAKSREFRSRAAQTLILFGTVLILAMLLAIPHQQLLALGIEILVVSALLTASAWALDRRAHEDEHPLASSRLLEAVTPNALTILLLLISGVLLAIGFGAGLYVLVGAILVATVGGLASAWLFLSRVTG